jgi:predicted amidohydrolase
MKQKKSFVATVLLESHKKKYGHTDNQDRLKTLLAILKETVSKTKDSGILLFPAGYFHTSNFRTNSDQYYKFTVPIIKALKQINNRKIVVCVGVDGYNVNNVNGSTPVFKDQIALALDFNGIVAAARKFHPTAGEKNGKGETILARDYLSKEKGKSRIFEVNGQKFYLTVCYDIYGIKHKNFQNPNVDGILNLVHRFTARCQCETEICKCDSLSGDVYWVKNGMAGASMKWGVPVYASTIF